jgi:hypothetical protein
VLADIISAARIAGAKYSIAHPHNLLLSVFIGANNQ